MLKEINIDFKKENIEDINTNPKKENTESMDDLLKAYYVKEVDRASEKVDKFIKMINDNPIPSKKSEIINKFKKMYYVKNYTI